MELSKTARMLSARNVKFDLYNLTWLPLVGSALSFDANESPFTDLPSTGQSCTGGRSTPEAIADNE
jgi:hypothetical protein